MVAPSGDPGCDAPDADPALPAVPEPHAQTDERGRPNGRLWRLVRIVLPVLVGAGAISLVASVAGNGDELVRAIHRVQPWLVAAALACELLRFVCLGVHLALLGGPVPNVRRLAPFRLAWLVFGFGSVLPAAPAEGLVMADSALHLRRLDRRRRFVVLGVSQFFAAASLYALAGISALIVVGVADDGPFPHSWTLAVGGGTTLVLLVLIGILATRARFAELVALIAGRVQHPHSYPPADERRAQGRAWHDAVMHVLDNPTRAGSLVVSALLAWVFDGMCLWLALRAVGVHVDLDVLLLAYTIGMVASFIPLLPAGLGVVETVTPAVLHLYGVAWAGALAGLLVYRVLGTLFPAVLGAGSLATLRIQSPPDTEANDASTAPSGAPSNSTGNPQSRGNVGKKGSVSGLEPHVPFRPRYPPRGVTAATRGTTRSRRGVGG